jgi:hypothetical protein
MKRLHVKMVVPWLDEPVYIGTLTREKLRMWCGQLIHDEHSDAEPQYVFRYDWEFQRRKQIQPLPEFPDLKKAYMSTRLFMFFAVRIPPHRRPDIEQLSRKLGVNWSDELDVLGKLSARTVTSPFEFELGETDVHTEHCCVHHGCKYGKSCKVEEGKQRQSFPCELCDEQERDDQGR